VISIIGFLIAPCCWTVAPKTSVAGIIGCSENKIGFKDSLQQKNNMAANNDKNSKH
jgi:hypothetical protein